MRIGLISGEYPPMQGGVGAYTQILARELCDLGHEIHLLTHASAVETDERIVLEAAINHWNSGSRRQLREWAMRHQVDVLHMQYQTAAYAMSPHIHFFPDAVRGIPFVTTFHDLRFPYLFPKAGPLRPWIVRHLAQRSHGAIVTNHEDAQELRDHPCLDLIPIGSNIHPATSDPVPRSGDDFQIAYFGFINRSKGVDLLLETLALARSQGEPWRLSLIGGQTGSSDPTNATYLLEIEAQIERLGLADCLTWTGYVDEAAVSAQLRAADAVVLPFRDGASYRRGSLIAAIQHGTAIVTTHPAVDVPAFVDGENVLYSDQSPTALMRTLQRLQADPALRKRLRAGAAKLAPTFDWKSIARRTAAMYERVHV